MNIVIDTERCKGCGLCVYVCPLGLLRISKELNQSGHHPAMILSNECSGCSDCAVICPDVAIEVHKDE